MPLTQGHQPMSGLDFHTLVLVLFGHYFEDRAELEAEGRTQVENDIFAELNSRVLGRVQLVSPQIVEPLDKDDLSVAHDVDLGLG